MKAKWQGHPIIFEPRISRCSTSHLGLDLVARNEQEILPVTKTAHSRQLDPEQENQSRQE